MDVRLIRAITLVLGLITAPFLEGKSSGQFEHQSLKLLVCNLVGLDAPVFNAAKQHALRIFANAGVQVFWDEGSVASEACAVKARDRYFAIIIARNLPDSWTSPDAMGVAFVNGPYPRA